MSSFGPCFSTIAPPPDIYLYLDLSSLNQLSKWNYPTKCGFAVYLSNLYMTSAVI